MRLTQAGALDSCAALRSRRRALSVGWGLQKSVITMRGVPPQGGEKRWRGLSGLERHIISLGKKRGHTAHCGHSQLPTQAAWATAVTPTESPVEHLGHFSRSLPSLLLGAWPSFKPLEARPSPSDEFKQWTPGPGSPGGRGESVCAAPLPLRCILGNVP